MRLSPVKFHPELRGQHDGVEERSGCAIRQLRVAVDGRDDYALKPRRRDRWWEDLLDFKRELREFNPVRDGEFIHTPCSVWRNTA